MPTVFQLSDGFFGEGAGKGMFNLPTLFIFNSWWQIATFQQIKPVPQ